MDSFNLRSEGGHPGIANSVERTFYSSQYATISFYGCFLVRSRWALFINPYLCSPNCFCATGDTFPFARDISGDSYWGY